MITPTNPATIARIRAEAEAATRDGDHRGAGALYSLANTLARTDDGHEVVVTEKEK